MHQSPQKPLAKRRDKYFDPDPMDSPAARKSSRGGQPKARKFPLRDETGREPRWDKFSLK